MQIVFDFDGVIINSHKIKTQGFYFIFKIYGNKIAREAKKYHEKNIGKSRTYKFRYILKNILHKKVTKKELLNLDHDFDNFIKKKNR